LQDLDRLGRHFHADPVAWQDRDVEGGAHPVFMGLKECQRE
jgi:hypothetical protein